MEPRDIYGIVTTVLRVIGAIVCYKIAKSANRNAGGWSVAGFFFPIIAMIWVSCLGYKRSKLNDKPSLKLFTKYYTENGIIEVENAGEKKVLINGKAAISGTYQLNRFESINVIDGKLQ